MGCDVHILFETRQADGSWALTFPRTPTTWWYEGIVSDKVEDGSAITIFGPPSDDEISEYRETKKGTQDTASDDDEVIDAILYRKLTAYFKSLSVEELITRYQDEPSFDWDYLPREGNGGYPAICSRNYVFFLRICRESVENRFSSEEILKYTGGNCFRQRGVPDDCCVETSQFVKKWAGDGHSHSWLMVREILNNQKHQPHQTVDETGTEHHYEWLTNNITDPDNTRMMFFFDN